MIKKHFRIIWSIEDWKEQNVLETHVFSYYIIQVLFVTFDQFNLSLLNHKKISKKNNTSVHWFLFNLIDNGI